MIGAFPLKLFITKNIKFMKKYFFMAVATLVVSVATIVGVKVYNYYSMPELMKANLEALSDDEIKDSDVVWHISTFDCELVIGFGIDAMLVSTKYNIPLAELFAGKKIDVSDYTVRCQLAKWWQSEERCPGVITCNQLFDEVRQIF